MGWSGRVFANGCAVGCQIAGQLSLENPEVLQRYLGERFGRNAKILGEHLGGRMGEPVCHQQRIELAGVAVVKADHEFASVRAETLQRMRVARREIPKVALIDVRTVWPAPGVENRNAAT